MKQKTQTKGADAQFRSLTSLNQGEYQRLLSYFSPLIEEKQIHYTLKGELRACPRFKEPPTSSLYGSSVKLDFMLMYMKENPNQAYHGYCFKMCQSKVSEWVSYLRPVLELALEKMGFMPQTGDSYVVEDKEIDYLLTDVTERGVPRRTDHEAQKEEYSGKKKCHTIKNLAITDPHGYVLFLSDSYEGKVHDKALWNDLNVESFELSLLADLGFLGIDKTHPEAILPYKKPKNGQLTNFQKNINSFIASIRVKVEHAFAGIKRMKIIRNKIRLKSWEAREQMMRIATALHNLRMVFRGKVGNQP